MVKRSRALESSLVALLSPSVEEVEILVQLLNGGRGVGSCWLVQISKFFSQKTSSPIQDYVMPGKVKTRLDNWILPDQK